MKINKIILLTLLFSFSNENFILSKANGTIVILNGTSSVGKTSITNELHKIYGNSYIILNGDDFLNSYFDKNPLPNDISHQESIEFGSKASCAMYEYAKQLSLNGKNVFVDVLRFDAEYEKYCNILGCENVIKILVYCPLNVIFERVEKRNKSMISKEQRFAFFAFEQFLEIYKLWDSKDDLVVDIVSNHSLYNSLNKAKKEFDSCLTKFPHNFAIEIISNLYPKFEKQFKLNNISEVILTTKHKWDLIVNTRINSVGEISKKILKYLKTI